MNARTTGNQRSLDSCAGAHDLPRAEETGQLSVRHSETCGYFWAASGKTPGMVMLGVQVVGQDGSPVGTKRGLVRTLAFPLSFLLLGLGFLGILLGRDRRALHDVIAGTTVVYDWDAREARLRSLARKGNGRRP
jgi:uncharacterized RDD family membrane protein YckC